MHFGQALKSWRLAKGLTQAELACQAGIPRPNLVDLELGRRDCTLKTLGRLAFALGINPGTLLEPAPLQEKNLERHEVDAIARSLFRDDKALPEGLRAKRDALYPIVLPILKAVGVKPPRPQRRHRNSTLAPELRERLIRRITKLAASLP